MNITWYSCM